MRSLLSLMLLAHPLVFAVHAPAVNHRELAKRAKGDLAQRTSGARWTFYEAGLGACGHTNSDSDFIVALNQQTFGEDYPSQYCFKQISMTYNGKATTATIMDSCPGCPEGGLDLTPSLFSFFADKSEGVIYGDWSFVDGSSGGGGGGGGGDNDHTTTKKTTTHHTTSTTKHTTTTHTTPTTTYTPPTTTSTTKSTTVSSTHSSSAASVSAPAPASASASPSSSHPVPSAPSNSLAEPSGTVSPSGSPQNLYGFAQAVIGLTTIVVDGGQD